MQNNSLFLILVIAIVVVALFLVVRSRKTPVAGDRPSAAVTPPPAEHGGLVDSAATAVEDVVGPLIGVDLTPEAHAGPADDLVALKGLGPKAAAQLNALGVTRYAQIASWTDAEIAAVDARLGPFKGRIARDKWVEQARLLAAGDKAGFEAVFGKLGG